MKIINVGVPLFYIPINFLKTFSNFYESTPKKIFTNWSINYNFSVMKKRKSDTFILKKFHLKKEITYLILKEKKILVQRKLILIKTKEY